jgi:hypothetical protein
VAGTPATHKILTWGNHDYCGQTCSFEGDAAGRSSSSALQILVDAAAAVPVNGGRRSITIWASPWSNVFTRWAFMQPKGALADVYAAIPAGVDILVSHQPPFGYGDRYEHPRTNEVEHLGSRELLAAIERVRPRFVICGHMHAGHGRYDCNGVTIYNVSLVNDRYQPARAPTVIDVADW